MTFKMVGQVNNPIESVRYLAEVQGYLPEAIRAEVPIEEILETAYTIWWG